ncbi:FAD-dependent oxidoreductase [Fodinicola feengrottensis]|uniref:FAD-dependent oxidoreductase n=1 Tax=Fodinicola feengrottensis TaxID=435914 RepID=A0ABP4T869_9ACTN
MSDPLLWSGDVIVAGGGSAGCAAAVAAAREGASVLLVESAGFFGGTGAAVLDTFYGFYPPGGNERVVGGIGWEVCEALFAREAAFERPNTYGAGTGVTYEPEILKQVWDDLLADADVTTLLHATVTDVLMDGDKVSHLGLHTAAGPRSVKAVVYIDATGDAELAWRAGAAVDAPRDQVRRQPMTATFRLGGVDLARTSAADLHRRMAEATGYVLPRREGSTHRTMLPGVVHTNLTRVSGADPTDPWQLSDAEREGRRQVREYVRFLTAEVPGYEQAYLINTSIRIGVRESRRLRGRYLLTRYDVLQAREFADAIARCGAPVEDHDGGSKTVWEYVGGAATGRSYGVPYGCLLPVEVGNLLVAGRCLSATHSAHASVRSMAQCFATGQAAGTAASFGENPADLDVQVLRKRLIDQGALL